jgi:dTDP-4-amino-4,6-dideoxygalactose transaminase
MNPNTDPRQAGAPGNGTGGKHPPFIPFARPSLGPEEERAVIAVMRSGWLTTGEVTRRFEQEFAEYVGARRALAVSSATAGLHLSLEALGVGSGDYVVTSPYTFTATAEVVRYLGADPLFVDIDPVTLNISPERVEEAVAATAGGRRIGAILPIHVGGLLCDMASLREIARAIPVVEDAAHAFPATSDGRFGGTFGSAGVFSFYATKTITTGEGGMIVTDDESAAARMAVMRLHGIDREIWDRYTSTRPSWEYRVVDAGYKYNMTDLAAAIGCEQLKKAQAFRSRRAEIARRYLEAFGGYDFLVLPAGGGSDHAWHLFTLRIAPDRLSIGRDEFIDELTARGIGSSVHFIPLHTMPYYRERYGFEPEDFPNAWKAYRTIFSLPIYPSLEDDHVERIIRAVIDIGSSHLRA